MPLPPPLGGRPPKTERPHRIPREHPITHHVTGPPHGEVADRDKPGRPRAPHPTPPPRPRTAQPTETSLQQHHRALDAKPQHREAAVTRGDKLRFAAAPKPG